MKRSIGRIVIYNTTKAQRDSGICNHQEKLPAIITAVWGDTEKGCVNLKVINDGTDNIWATSVSEGDQENNWNWPVKN